MPSATEKPDEKAMAEEAASAGGAEDRHEREEDQREARQPLEYRAPSTKMGGGFFHLYKSGQGYWTRMGTAGGAALVGLLMANFIYSDLAGRIDYLQKHRGIALAIAVGFLVVYGLLVWWYINRPTIADFLIATDSEMKKVNWTSRKELFGSTKIVIIFMFLIAFMLFAIDIIFGYVFYWFHVLKNPPF
jgi:preprotein translocase SecE subunit